MFRRKDEEETNESGAANANSANNKPATESKTEVKEENKPAAPAATATPAATPRPATPVAATPVSAPAAPRPAAPVAAPVGARPATAGASSQQEDKKRRVLTVGNDILLKGEIATCDRLVIEGAVDAKLKDVHTVEIAESGSFKGGAEIEDAEISGLFEGDLTVRNRLVIYSTGKVRGKITYGEIEIERGGELTGEIKTGSSAAAESKEDKSKKAA